MHPFRDTSEGTAGDLGERRLIERIRQWLGDASPPPPHGIGDDCAVFELGRQSSGLVTTDPILWKRHFDENVSPADAAAKLVRRNLSDLAAMGGRPVTAVVSLLLPAATSLPWLEAFYLGLRLESRRYALPIAGGDVSQTDGLLGACLTVIGESTHGRVLRRDGARVGDAVFVTGELGGSILGRHVAFEPRLAEGQWLCARSDVSAAIDVSDGLSKDLLSLVPDQCVADLLADAIPVSEAARSAASQSGKSPLAHAVSDGEDYELLFTVNGQSDVEKLLVDWNGRFPTLPITLIARIRKKDANDGFPIAGLPTDLRGVSGYEHFR